MANKLVIYETTHFEILPAIIKLASPLFDEVYVYANHGYVFDMVHEELQPYKNVKWVCRNEAQCGNRSFIKKMFLHIRKERFTHLHVSTLDHNLFYFSYKLFRNSQLHVSFTIHAINNYTQYQFGNVKKITETLSKIFLHKRVQHYLVLMPLMAPYFKNKLPQAVIEFIPANFYQQKEVIIMPGKLFRIIVPGSVELKRRHYEHLVEACKYIFEGNAKPIEIVLLGKSDNDYAKQIIDTIKKLIGNRADIFLTTFENTVPENNFIDYFNSADVIFSPLQKVFKKSDDDVVEVNGLSHSTGLFADIIKFPAPLIIPGDISLSHDFKNAVNFYHSAKDAADIILRFINEPATLELAREKMVKACSKYSIEAFEKSFKNLFNMLTS